MNEAQPTRNCQFCGREADHKCGDLDSCGDCCGVLGLLAHYDKEAYEWFYRIYTGLRAELVQVKQERDRLLSQERKRERWSLAVIDYLGQMQVRAEDAEARESRMRGALEKMGMEHGCEPGVEGEEELMLCPVCLKAFRLLESSRKRGRCEESNH